jgi:branched-subunit amino acid ABC-type transport system permease component
MQQYFQFALLGVGAGVLYAALAQGLVLAYRGSGVINIALGAMAMYIAYTYNGMRFGRLMLPPLPNPLALVEGIAGWFGADLHLPNWPTFIDLGGPIPAVAAFPAALAIAALLGLTVHQFIFRLLRNAPALAKAVASVGIALTLRAIVALRFGTESVAVPRLLPNNVVTVWGARVPVDRFILLGVAVVIAVALTIMFRYTRVGLATRASAENERGATLLGLSPDRLAALNWMLSSVVAGGVGIMFASLTGLNPTDFVLYVIPALGAALAAKLDSFIIAGVAGLLIGVLQSLTLPLQSDLSWFPKTGAADGIPFLVIMVVMIVRGNKLPGRGSVMSMRLPAFPAPGSHRRLALVGVPLVLLGLVYLPFDLRSALINSLAGVVMALSFVVLVGMAGQISLMQMTIAGMAALAMTRLAGDWGLPFPLAPLLAVLVAAAAGLLAGLPALRVRGVHLAVLTLGAAYAFEKMVLVNGDFLRTSDVSGSVPEPKFLGLDFGINQRFPIGNKGAPSAWFGMFVLTIVLVSCFAVLRLRRSRTGLRFLAMRSNERAAVGLGIGLSANKIRAFSIAALFAGTAGTISAYQFEGVTASQYAALVSVTALATAYLGGISSVSGALLAGMLAVGGVNFRLAERLFHAGRWEPLLAGFGLILMAVLNPEGIAGALRQTRHKIVHWWNARAPRSARRAAPETAALQATNVDSG